MSSTPDVAVVTGAAVGIGRAITERLLADGIRVVGLDRDDEALREASAALGDGFEGVAGDVSVWADHERAADAAERTGRLRYWVSNAGIDFPGAAHEMTAERIERGVGVLQFGVMFGCSVAVQRMLESGGGSIVNIASIQGTRAFPPTACMTRPKAAVIMATKSIALDHAPAGIARTRCCPAASRDADAPSTTLPPELDIARRRVSRREGSARPCCASVSRARWPSLVASRALRARLYITGTEMGVARRGPPRGPTPIHLRL